ncbi:Citrate transporter [Gracilaria domingensis]|nr:Citrate transporter [Gracilaria domingensis]
MVAPERQAEQVKSSSNGASPLPPSEQKAPDVLHLEIDAPTPEMIHPDPAKDVVDVGTHTSDFGRTAGVGIFFAIVAALLQHTWVLEHRDMAMSGIFVLGYLGIILEETLAFDKTGVALLMGVGVWTVLMTDATSVEAAHQVKELLSDQIAEISQILFFLIGAMTIVEIIDAHRGFKVVTDYITTNNRKILLWTIGVLTFFVSAVLDNLTSTIVVVSLLRKLVADPKERLLFGAAVVIAANAGGAWTPIGDVTTTQLWVHGNISALKTMTDLFLPSFVSMVVSLAMFTPMIGKGEFERPNDDQSQLAPRAPLVFWSGLAALVSVPIFKTVTGLPPYIGMLSGLGFLWVMTDVLHAGEDRESLRGLAAIKRIDTSGVLFFLGILLAVGGLESAGILETLAHSLDSHVASREIIATAIGLLSSIVDNVPLVAATMGMYSLDQIPPDGLLWQLIAFCAGTGGSILIIGSAAGVAFM